MTIVSVQARGPFGYDGREIRAGELVRMTSVDAVIYARRGLISLTRRRAANEAPDEERKGKPLPSPAPPVPAPAPPPDPSGPPPSAPPPPSTETRARRRREYGRRDLVPEP